MANYEAMIKRFFEEHLHADEEVRYCLEGSGMYMRKKKLYCIFSIIVYIADAFVCLHLELVV